MKLQKSTKVNSVMFLDKSKNDTLVFSQNLNMTFGDYLSQCQRPLYSLSGDKQAVPTSINKMLEFNYTLDKTVKKGGYTFLLYSYSDNHHISSYIELI